MDVKDLKKKIFDVIYGVASEELGIPPGEINGDTKLPLKEGMKIAMRMANAIPGGGIIHVTPTSGSILCTIDQLADRCTEEMVRLLEKANLRK